MKQQEQIYTTLSVTFDEEAILMVIQKVIEQYVRNEINTNMRRENGAIKTWIKEELYSHKDEIIERIVERASKEMVRKGMRKFIEGMNDQEEENGDKFR